MDPLVEIIITADVPAAHTLLQVLADLVFDSDVDVTGMESVVVQAADDAQSDASQADNLDQEEDFL
jgi:hypothetical protein